MSTTDPTSREAAKIARQGLKDYGEEYLTPDQFKVMKAALNYDAPVLFRNHPTLGEMAFLVFRPVPESLEESLTDLVRAADARRAAGDFGNTRYVTDNSNFPQPYWELEC